MNRFIEAVETKFLENVASRRFSKLSVQVEMNTPETFGILGKHRLTIRWSEVITCSTRDYPRARRNFMDGLKEFVFGEYREKLSELEVAIFEERDRDALQILDEIRRAMYG